MDILGIVHVFIVSQNEHVGNFLLKELEYMEGISVYLNSLQFNYVRSCTF